MEAFEHPDGSLEKEFEHDENKSTIIRRHYSDALEMSGKYTLCRSEQKNIIRIGFQKFFLFEHLYLGNRLCEKEQVNDFLDKMMLYGAVSYFRHSLKQLTFIRFDKYKFDSQNGKHKLQDEAFGASWQANAGQMPEFVKVVFYLIYEKALTVRELSHCLEISVGQCEGLLKRLYLTSQSKESQLK